MSLIPYLLVSTVLRTMDGWKMREKNFESNFLHWLPDSPPKRKSEGDSSKFEQVLLSNFGVGLSMSGLSPLSLWKTCRSGVQYKPLSSSIAFRTFPLRDGTCPLFLWDHASQDQPLICKPIANRRKPRLNNLMDMPWQWLLMSRDEKAHKTVAHETASVTYRPPFVPLVPGTASFSTLDQKGGSKPRLSLWQTQLVPRKPQGLDPKVCIHVPLSRNIRLRSVFGKLWGQASILALDIL